MTDTKPGFGAWLPLRISVYVLSGLVVRGASPVFLHRLVWGLLGAGAGSALVVAYLVITRPISFL